jgi:L-rhamnose-H+ transport protein
MNPLVPGFGLIFLAAVCGGAFALPLRIRRRYAVENTMVVAMGFATLVVPTIAVAFVLPAWPQAIAAGGPIVFAVMAMGFGWGCGSVTFAMGVSTLGLGLGYPIIMGLSTVIGSVIPMLTKWGDIPGPAKAVTILGIAVCVVGVVLIGKAGELRERGGEPAADSKTKPVGREVFIVGLVWCLLSGVLSPCANLGFHFAEPIGKAAETLHVSPLFATLPRWMPMYWGGYLAILIFMGSGLVKNRTYANFAGGGAFRDFLLAIAMGLLHFLAQIPYGMGAHYLGTLGTTVGWVVNIASSIIVAAWLGTLTGEWRKAPNAAFAWRNAGLAVLIAAICILAYANSIKP